MKKFRVLNIVETVMEVTEQRVAVVELVEIKYDDISLPSGDKFYSFGGEGNRFVVDLYSSLTKKIIDLAEQEEIVQLD